jgi:hypothetical protein
VRLAAGVALLLVFLGPASLRACSRASGPTLVTSIGHRLSWRPLARSGHFSPRSERALRHGLLEIGDWTRGCTRVEGPAIVLGDRALELPWQARDDWDRPLVSFAGAAQAGIDQLVPAFQSSSAIHLLETRDGGRSFAFLATIPSAPGGWRRARGPAGGRRVHRLGDVGHFDGAGGWAPSAPPLPRWRAPLLGHAGGVAPGSPMKYAPKHSGFRQVLASSHGRSG